MAKQRKWYVVWAGRKPGIYTNWRDCKTQVENFPRARYKSFTNEALAESSYQQGRPVSTLVLKEPLVLFDNYSSDPIQCGRSRFNPNSVVVDAAFSGATRQMEYKGIDLLTGQVLFKQGPFEQATGNLGEFLAVVHALSLLKQKEDTRPVYTDSVTALAWVRKKQVNTSLVPTPKNERLRELVKRAITWLTTNTYTNPVLKWETADWGENPADFGRK